MQDKITAMDKFFDTVKWVCDNYFDGTASRMANAAGMNQPTFYRIYKREVESPDLVNVYKLAKLIADNNIELPEEYKGFPLFISQDPLKTTDQVCVDKYVKLLEKHLLIVEENKDLIKKNAEFGNLLNAFILAINTHKRQEGKERRQCRIEYEKILKNAGATLSPTPFSEAL